MAGLIPDLPDACIFLFPLLTDQFCQPLHILKNGEIERIAINGIQVNAVQQFPIVFKKRSLFGVAALFLKTMWLC